MAEQQRHWFNVHSLGFGVVSPIDWCKVSVSQLAAKGGGSGILAWYSNSSIRALQVVYPEYEWNSQTAPSGMRYILFAILSIIYNLSSVIYNL